MQRGRRQGRRRRVGRRSCRGIWEHGDRTRVGDEKWDEEIMIWSFLSIVYFEMGIPKGGSTLQALQRYQLSVIASRRSERKFLQ
jgi:hypothetical protein